MTTQEMAEEVAHLKGLFPKTSTYEEDFWAERFLRYDKAAVHKAIERHGNARGADLHIDRPALLACIANEQSKRVEELRQELIREAQECKASWSNIDAFIESCADEDLSDLKGAALAASRKLNDGAKEMLAKFDPRLSKTLRWLIFQYVSHAGKNPPQGRAA